jgi:hypothetical protein
MLILLWIRIRVDLAVLDPDLDPYWDYRLGSITCTLTPKLTNKPGLMPLKNSFFTFVGMSLTYCILESYFLVKPASGSALAWLPGSGSAWKPMWIHSTEFFSPFLPSVLLSYRYRYHQNQCCGSGSGRIRNFWPDPD